MEQSKKGFLPMSHGIHLSKTQCPSTTDELDHMNKVPYASAIGSMYAMISTCLDVSYALSATSRYQSDPGESHWTKDVFLVYGGEEELTVMGYTDASFQTDNDDSKLQLGFVFTLNGGAVSWKSSKWDTVADSTIEAEYLIKIGAFPNASSPLNLYYDKTGAIAKAKEPKESPEEQTCTTGVSPHIRVR
jgi:hypothetical protein